MALPSKSTISIHYHGVKKNTPAHGFLGLKRLYSHSDSTRDSDSESSSSVIMSRTSSRLSQISVASSIDLQDKEETLEDQLYACIEDLEDKRAATRVQATQKLLKLLSTKYLVENLSDSDVRRLIILSRKLITGNGPESIQYCKVCSAIWITCGPDAENYSTIFKSLSYVIKNASQSLQAAAINSLSLISVLEENEDYEQLLKSLANMIINQDQKEFSDEVIVAALSGYGLIFSHNQPELDSEEFNEIVEKHIELLDSSLLDIRVGSSENLALLIEVLRNRMVRILFFSITKKRSILLNTFILIMKCYLN